MLKAIIRNPESETFSGVSKATGQPFKSITQEVWIDLGGFSKIKTTLRLKEGQAPFAEGEYELNPDSFDAGRYGGLEWSGDASAVGKRVSTSSVQPISSTARAAG